MIYGFNFISFRRFILQILLSVSLLGAAGCASTPAPLAPEHRMQLGRVGVLALSSTPRVEFHTFAKGWAAGAAKGGAYGAVDGLLSTLAEAFQHSPNDPYALAGFLIASAVIVTVNTAVYGVEGGLEAVPGKTARQIEQELNAAIGDVSLASDLASEICAISILRPELDPYAVSLLETSASGDASLQFGNLSQKGIDAVVEVQFTEAGFRGGSGAQPSVSFYLNARIRLLSTDNGTEIYTRDFQFMSRELPFAQWFSDGSKQLLSGFRQAMAVLAERIVDELFIVTRFPFESGLWAFPGQPEFGSCWFCPIYPELKYTSLWDSIRNDQPGIQIRYAKVDSLQPLFRWEPFPRPRDQKPANASLLSEIADVSYDLKIWEAAGENPARLVYDITGLHDSQYRPPLPLKPRTKYFWTIRARYKMAGQAQVTRWAFSSIPSNAPSEYPQRPLGGTCDLDAIPSTNYFRFITP